MLANFIFAQTYQLVTHVMDPSVVFGTGDFVAAAVVIGLDRQRIGAERSHLEVMDGDTHILTRNTLFQDYLYEMVHGSSGIKYVVNEQHAVTATQMFGTIRPTIYHHSLLLMNVGVAPRNDRSVEDRPALISSDHLEVLTDYISEVCTAAKTYVDHIGDKAVSMYPRGELEGIVAYRIVLYEFLRHSVLALAFDLCFAPIVRTEIDDIKLLAAGIPQHLIEILRGPDLDTVHTHDQIAST